MDLFSVRVAYASVDSFVSRLNTLIINPLITFLFALAVLYFLYGMLEFIMNQTNEEKKTSGKSHMLWGVIGITIMMGVWFILGIIQSTLNIPKSQINPEEGTVNLSPYEHPNYPPNN